MLAQIGVNRFGFYYTNELPSIDGTSVVPGASNVEGSWTQVASGANIAQDIYFFTVTVSLGATSTQIKSHLLDIGIDPAGGTSYTERIANIVCGHSGTSLVFRFPLFIAAGSSVAVRIQGSHATPGTVIVGIEFFGQPSHPELIRVGQYVETIGTITNSVGVAFTPGVSDAEGTWVSLGTTARPLWWWQLCVQPGDSSMLAQSCHFDLAYGDGSNKHMIIQNLTMITAGPEDQRMIRTPSQCFADLPAGAELWVRGSCGTGTADTGWNAVAVGIGG